VHISAATVVTRSILQAGPVQRLFPIDDNASWEKNAATLRSCTPARALRRSRRRQPMTAPMMDIHQILKKLPHRYPFLLVDRVLELEKGKRIKALKNVTINEPFFTGHFPAPAGDARRADARGAGAGGRAAVVRVMGRSPTTTRWCTSSASTARASSGRSSRATS
jgi:hypothetical protein